MGVNGVSFKPEGRAMKHEMMELFPILEAEAALWRDVIIDVVEVVK